MHPRWRDGQDIRPTSSRMDLLALQRVWNASWGFFFVSIKMIHPLVLGFNEASSFWRANWFHVPRGIEVVLLGNEIYWAFTSVHKGVNAKKVVGGQIGSMPRGIEVVRSHVEWILTIHLSFQRVSMLTIHLSFQSVSMPKKWLEGKLLPCLAHWSSSFSWRMNFVEHASQFSRVSMLRKWSCVERFLSAEQIKDNEYHRKPREQWDERRADRT